MLADQTQIVRVTGKRTSESENGNVSAKVPLLLAKWKVCGDAYWVVVIARATVTKVMLASETVPKITVAVSNDPGETVMIEIAMVGLVLVKLKK